MAGQKIKTLAARATAYRSWVQGGFLFVWLSPFIKLHGICAPVFHCYSCPLSAFACPIGVIANFSALHVVPFLALGMLALAGASAAGFICGWACPFGFLQDMLGKLPIPRARIPRWAGYTRYAVLGGLVIAVPFFLGETHPLFICRLCPAGALEGAYPNIIKTAIAGGAIAWPSVAKTTVVVLLVSAMFVSHRPWCRILCPLGAIYGLANRASAFFLHVNRAACTGCGACAKICRYGVDPLKSPNDSRCIRCLECTACPTRAIGVGNVFGRPVPAPEPEPAPPAEG